jgi:release factor glutamine methyltransferase
VPTVGELLSSAVERLRVAGSESARLDAEVLLASAIGTERTTLLAYPEVPVGPEVLQRFEGALARRSRGEPVAYIRGIKEFFGLAFVVDNRPRGRLLERRRGSPGELGEGQGVDAVDGRRDPRA